MKSSLPMWGVLVACGLAGWALPAGAAYVNTTAGGPLRPGVYGHIEIGKSAPPPLIYNEPVVGSRALVAAGVKPVYLYVPPGQVRRWSKHCGKYNACELPVYFVRMDNSPSKLGKWKNRSEASDREAARLALRTPSTFSRQQSGPPGYRD